MQHRRVWAEIDLDAITSNLQTIRNAIGPGKGIMAIVKANAYGHESIPIGWHLASLGVDMLGVGDSQEAIELRCAGVSIPILVLGAIVSGELSDVVSNNIAITVHSNERVRVLEREARRARQPVSVHLKVDTGMARLGCKPSSALELARLIHSCDHLRFDGICTHFSSVGSASAAGTGDDNFTDRQVRTFNRVVGEIERAGIPVPRRHAAASAAILRGVATHLDMVRPGLSLYGIGPSPELQAGLTPALSLKTQVIFLKDCPAQTPVGYNRTHVTPQRTRVATLPVGYNDGYPFRLGGRGQVIIRGRKCSVIGRVSMDYLTVDVGHVPGVSVGDEVVLIGASGRESITATDLAEQCGTIPYEILTRIGRRVERVYLGGRTPRSAAEEGAREADMRGFGILHRPGVPTGPSEIEPGRR